MEEELTAREWTVMSSSQPLPRRGVDRSPHTATTLISNTPSTTPLYCVATANSITRQTAARLRPRPLHENGSSGRLVGASFVSEEATLVTAAAQPTSALSVAVGTTSVFVRGIPKTRCTRLRRAQLIVHNRVTH